MCEAMVAAPTEGWGWMCTGWSEPQGLSQRHIPTSRRLFSPVNNILTENVHAVWGFYHLLLALTRCVRTFEQPMSTLWRRDPLYHSCGSSFYRTLLPPTHSPMTVWSFACTTLWLMPASAVFDHPGLWSTCENQLRRNVVLLSTTEWLREKYKLIHVSLTFSDKCIQTFGRIT